MSTSRMKVIVIALAAITLWGSSPLLAHEDHEKLGAGPGKPAQMQPAGADDHAGMTGMGRDGPVDMAMGRDVAADDMAMGHAHDKIDTRNKTFGQRLTSWLGRLHIVVIHFPIAMVLGALAVELFGLRRRSAAYSQAARVMLVIGALGAVAAASLGWFAAGFYWTDRNPVLMTHRWLGTTIAIFSVVLAVVALRGGRIKGRPATLYWGLLGTLAIAIAVQGWLGGSFMHGGLNHLAF